MQDLKDIRTQIDSIDSQMLSLFEQRMRLSREVAEFKMSKALPVRDIEREQAIISSRSAQVSDDDVREYYGQFQRQVIDLSCQYQERLMQGLKVAYSGLPGAFSHSAAMRMFPSAKYIAFNGFPQAYEACSNGECDIAVLPLENSFAGGVSAVTDLMFGGSLCVNQVIEVEAGQNLLAPEGASLESIKDVLSHPQALSQCSQFLRERGYTPHEASNTAIAAQIVAQRADPTLAAIASSDCAKLYGLQILAPRINVSSTNTTRFGAFSRSLSSNSQSASHFILMFTVRNEAGSLSSALNIIGAHGFNMSCLRSRPLPNHKWNYYFYLELDGRVSSSEGREMMLELSTICEQLKLVGSF